MHPYAVDTGEHREVVFKLLAPAVIVAIGLQWFWGWLLDSTFQDPPVWLLALLGPAGAVGVLAFVLGRIERGWWSNGLVRWCCGISTPDLRGTWTVDGATSYEGAPRKWSATTTIDQTWTRISVYQDAQFSYSQSTSASIRISAAPTHLVLTYEYRNTPKPDAYPTMHAHRGFTELRMANAACPLTMKGSYYTHPKERSNWGSMSLLRQ